LGNRTQSVRREGWKAFQPCAFQPSSLSAFQPFYYLISMAKPTFYTKPT
jgi:hypothetical protein